MTTSILKPNLEPVSSVYDAQIISLMRGFFQQWIEHPLSHPFFYRSASFESNICSGSFCAAMVFIGIRMLSKQTERRSGFGA